MLSFLRTNTPRTRSSHLNPVFYENGRGSLQFHNPSKPFMATATVPATTTEHGRSFLNPPEHFHMYQSETFHVVSGLGRFKLDGTSQVYPKGSIIDIPVAAFHAFENASEDGEDLVVDFRLDKQRWATDESFFRNSFAYLDDVRKAGQQPSICQLALFLYSADGPPAFPALGLRSNWLSRHANWAIMVVAGLWIGKWLLGYKATYEEYYAGEGQKDK